MKVYNNKLKYRDPVTKEFKALPIGANIFYENGGGADIEFKVTDTNENNFGMWTGVEKITIPEGVTGLAQYAFASNSSSAAQQFSQLKEVSLPSTLTSIGSYAFYYSPIQKIDIPENVTEIKDYAFSRSKLTKVTVPKNVTKLGTGIFSYANLEEAHFEGDNIPLSSNLFSNCENLKKVNSEALVCQNAGYSNAFAHCKSLEEIKINPASTVIPNAFVLDCPKITEVELPEGITSIGTEAFYQSGLTSVNLPSSIKTLANRCFASTPLKEITLPASITTLSTVNSTAGGCFYSCTSLEKAVVQTTAKSIGLFSSCTVLTDVSLPEGLKTIYQTMFRNCTALPSITIPSTVINIEANAFLNCTSLTEITIPASVVSIYNTSFSGCSNLTTITVKNTEDSIAGAPWGASNATVVWQPET